MDTRIDQRATASNQTSGMARLQWLVRKLSRRDSASLALPLSLAVLGGTLARERDAEMQRDGAGAEADAAAAAPAALQAGDRLALMSGEAVLLEHLLTEADLAAGQVRVALRMIDSARLPGMRMIELAEAGSAAVHDLDAAADAAGAEMQAGSATAGEGEGEVSAFAESSGSPAEAAGTAAAASGSTAAQDDDDDHGLLWLALGVGAVGAGLALIYDDKDDSQQLHTISGQVVKGYVQGAAVYLDIDGDGQPDGEPVYTDAEGRFTLTTDQAGASIIVYGGVDTLTNVPFEGMLLRAPAGSTVVTPLTTLLDEMMRQDASLDAAAAQSRLLAAFGLTLPAGTDLRTYDPVAGVATDGGAAEDRSEVVLNTIASIQSLLTGAGAAGDIAAANAAISAIARAARQSDSLDLTNADDLQAVLEDALAGTGVGASNSEDLAALAGAIASVNGTLSQASGLGEEALQASRYAFSGFQDLLTGIGAATRGSEQYDRDLSLGGNSDLADIIDTINGGGLGEVIGAGAGLSISFAERHEGGRYVLALNPELKFHDGKPDTIDEISVRFDVEGVVVQLEKRGTNGQLTVETLVADGEGRYQIAYADLDKVYFQAPENFNGVLGAEVSVHYVGLDVTDTPPKVGIRIDAVNDAPGSADATVSAVEDEPYVFSLADFPFTDETDAAFAGGANNLAAIRIVSLPASGTLLLGEDAIEAGDLADGLFVSAADIAEGRLRFVADADANGEGYASFQFQVKDDGGTERGGVDLDPTVHTLTIDVAPVSDAPVATAGAATVLEEGEHNFSAAEFGFTDVDGDALAGVVITSLPEAGNLYFDGVRLRGEDLGEGGFTVSAEELGLLSYRPPEEYNDTATFEYRVIDAGSGGANLSNVATMSVAVTPVSDAPVAGENSASTDEDVERAFSAEDFSFTDIDGDSLAAVLVTGLPAHGELRFDGVALDADDLGDEGFVVAIADLGRLTYVSSADFHGDDSFAYRLRDSGTLVDGGENTSEEATFALQVQPVSDAPTAGNAFSMNEDGVFTFTADSFGFEDVDGDALAAVIITTLPENGRLVYDGHSVRGEHLGEDGLVIAVEDLDKLTFEPAADYNGPVSFGFRVRDTGSDGLNLSKESFMHGVVMPVSDAPVAVGNTVDMSEDGEYTFSAEDFPFSDVDGDALSTVIITSLPEECDGALYFDGEPLTMDMLAAVGFAIDAADLGLLTFRPAGNFNGEVSFSYRVQDNGGTLNDGRDTSTDATLTLNIAAVNDAPVAQDAEAVVIEGGAYYFRGEDFPFSDEEGDSLAAVIITSLPGEDEGTLYFGDTALTADDLAEGGFSVAVGALGQLRFEPTGNFNGTASFGYRLQDDGGTDNDGEDTSAEATFALNVAAVNDAPVAVDSTVRAFEDHSYTFRVADFRFTDVEGDGLAAILITSLPGEGSLYLCGEELSGENISVTAQQIADGQLVFQPAKDFNGHVTLGFKVQDDGGTESGGEDTSAASATLTLKVRAVNDAPEVSLVVAEALSPEPVGVSYQVNTFTAGKQESPVVTALADGGYVIVWTSKGQDEADDSLGIYGQRYDAAGQKVGEEFQVNDTAAHDQFAPVVTAHDQGGFTVTWTSISNEGGNVRMDLFTRGFGADGEAGAEIQFPGSDHFDRSFADVAVAQSQAMVVWTSDGQDASGYGIQAMLLGAGGQVGPVQINTSEAFDQFDPKVVALADGTFVVTWTGVDGTNSRGVFAQRVAADGTLIGDEVLVNTTTEGHQEQPVIAVLNDGSYVIAWTGVDGSGRGVFAQMYDAGGCPVGGEVRVNAETQNEQFGPSVVALPTGGFLVAWTSWGSLDSALDVFAQRFGSDGLQLGESVVINNVTVHEQSAPALAVLQDGSVVVTWQSHGEDGSEMGIFARQLAPFAPVFIEGGAPVLIAANATVSDVELDQLNEGNGDWSGASLTIGRGHGGGHGHGHGHGKGRSPDEFGFVGNDVYWMGEDGVLYKEGGQIGTFSQERGELVVTFGSQDGEVAVTTADVNYILQHITYRNTSDNPGESVELQYRLNDGNGRHGEQGIGRGITTGTLEIQIVPVNDAPEARHNSVRIAEDNSHTFDLGDFRFRDAEGDELESVIIVSLPDAGTQGRLFYNGCELTQEQIDEGLLVSRDDLECGRLEFRPNEDFNGTVTFGYQIQDNGGTAHNGVNTSEVAMMTVKVQAVNDAPEISLPDADCGVDFIEGGDPARIAAGAQVSDVELDALNGGLGDWSGASITIGRKDDDHGHGWNRHGKGRHHKSDDVFGFEDDACAGLSFSNGEIIKTVDEVQSVIGHYRTTNAGKLVITFSTEDGDGSAVPTSEDVNNVLNLVTYSNRSENPAESVTLEVRVSDGNGRWHGEQGRGGEKHATTEITVNITPVNDAPAARRNSLRIDEDQVHTFEVADFRFRDAENDDLQAVLITGLPQNGTLYFNGCAVTQEQVDCGFSVTREDLECGRLTFTPAPDFHGSISFTYQVQDDGGTTNGGQDTSAEATFRISVRSVNDAPELSMEDDCGPGERDAFVEGGDAVRITPNVTLTDVELDSLNEGLGDWSGATIHIGRKHGGHGEDSTAAAEDVYGFDNGNGLCFVAGEDGNGVIYKSVEDGQSAIGTYSIVNGRVTISFSTEEGDDSAVPTSADVNNVLRQVTYANQSENPAESVTIAYYVSDGNGRWHGEQGRGGPGREVGTIEVEIKAVNDAPEIDDQIVTLQEDQGYTFSLDDFSITDAEGHGLASLLIETLPVNGTLLLHGEPVTAEMITCGFEVSAEDIACGNFSFAPNQDYYGATDFDYRVRDTGGTDNDGVDVSEVATFTFDMRSVNDAPDLVIPVQPAYTYVVDTLEDAIADDGKLSLREALALAQDGDSITFADEVLGGSILLGSTLVISKEVYINGAPTGEPESGITLKALGGFTMLEVTGDVGDEFGGAVLQGMVIDGEHIMGVSDSARGLLNHGNLTLADMEFRRLDIHGEYGSTAVAAIYNNGTLHASDVMINDSSAEGEDGDPPVGPGDAFIVYNSGAGEMHLVNFLMEGNVVQGGDAAPAGDEWYHSSGGSGVIFFNDGELYGAPLASLEGEANVANAGDGPSTIEGFFGGDGATAPIDWSFVPPAIGDGETATADFKVGGEAVLLAPGISVRDVELDALNGEDGNWSGATITVQRQGGASADDVFGHEGAYNKMPMALQWDDEAHVITKEGEVIATFSNAGGQLQIHFTGFGDYIPTTHDVNSLLQQITYRNSSPFPDDQVVIQYKVADGNASVRGAQGGGGEGITYGTVTVNIEVPEYKAPSVTLVSDSNEPGDGVTNVNEPTFRVDLAGTNAIEGLVVRLYVRDSAEPFAAHTLTADDICRDWVDLTVPEPAEDGHYAVFAVMASPDNQRWTDASAPYYMDLDTRIAPPELDFTSIDLHADAADGFVVTGTAEAFSEVRLRVAAVEGEPQEYSATADVHGRFNVQIAAGALGLGPVSVIAWAIDRAGNVSAETDPSVIEVGEAVPGFTIDGTDDDDVFAPEAEVTTFVPGEAWGQDYFIGSEAGFHTIQIDGSSRDYTITLVTGEERAVQGNLLQTGYDIAFEADAPLYRIDDWTSPGEILWVQADRIVFTGNGVTVTLANSGAVVASGEDTTLHGGVLDDYLVGGAGNDTLFGHDGSDVLVGGAGDDMLVSNSGSDTLIGGAGNDVLVALGDPAAGEDSTVDMHGGAGEDVFVIAPGRMIGGSEVTIHKDVTIHDFVIGEDRIDLSRMFVNDEGCIREATIDDLDLGALTSQLHENGVMEIDLGAFVREDGASLQGSLEVRLAGGVSTIGADSFIFDDECSPLYEMGDLMNQAYLLEPL